MAFNFNWSPLTADADFYRRARDLLTKALNKSPKPPIIVDDILVSEFNLGTLPPDLEILEIGDLAEDRFRGIFKMCYSGDAFLTLKTRVQANPLNTYLYSKPTFTSPQPLAAASGLTIPLSITLSEIKLSAFIILVFSKQKGLTLVFRNDPLESLKVSSTFDSIQFVRDYLQRTIEQQLRNLMMEELPAIIHRLSLHLWCPDQANKGQDTPPEETGDDEKAIDPFAIPPADPVDFHGNLVDPNALSEIALNGGSEMQSLFSQKNLLRLAALTDSHRTLSLFSPGIRDVVFRAWSGYADRSESVTPAPSLPRTYSLPSGASTIYTFSDSGSTMQGSMPSRSSTISLGSLAASLTHGPGHRSRPGRKKKTRVVNLRRAKPKADGSEDDVSEPISDDASMRTLPSETMPDSVPEEYETETQEANQERSAPAHQEAGSASLSSPEPRAADALRTRPSRHALEQTEAVLEPYDSAPVKAREDMYDAGQEHGCSNSDTCSVILEQAWIMKMAGEIARRVYDEKKRHGDSLWDDAEHPPPAYEAATKH
ncbi:hypothetical protein CDD81_4105 [Ophiocordyceps australis]|uniref:Mitochondrial distribution and morphology protein 34 n=1 Tax=Ophiocordyceps australis TaxID=1399860 RepID=A0A2C5YCH7_9HYPO|nr:hypothetical protein CDD81_4105 [Ophiocordyceps australis]